MKKLLLLHGALGSKNQFNDLAAEIKNDFIVYSISFSGHGENSNSGNDYSIKLFSSDVIKFLEEEKISSVNIFGYSMGGYVALYLAVFYPDLIEGIFTLGTKFIWNAETAAKEAAMLDPGIMEQKIPAYTASLSKRHGANNFHQVILKTASMMVEMGEKNPLTENDFRHIKNKVLLALGDQDKMIARKETDDIQKLIPGCSLLILNDTPHPLEKVNIKLLADELRKFFG